jgi:archaellum component FlaC
MAEAETQGILNEAFRRLNENTGRLRALEERYDLVENRITSLQDSLIKNTADDRLRADKAAVQLAAIEERLVKMENDLARLAKLMEKTAKESEIAQLRELVGLYSPFKKKASE